MKSCCDKENVDFQKLEKSQARVLVVVLVINATMFFIEFGAGLKARSTSLMADSLDMFGDALVYGLSLYVLHRGDIWKTRISIVKGSIMLLLGATVLLEVVLKLISPVVPKADVIGVMALIVLVANSICLFLLTPHRRADINMQSAWLCSRNDILSNIGVLIAGGFVYLMNSAWPDIIVGVLISFLVLRSSWGVLKEGREKLRTV